LILEQKKKDKELGAELETGGMCEKNRSSFRGVINYFTIKTTPGSLKQTFRSRLSLSDLSAHVISAYEHEANQSARSLI